MLQSHPLKAGFGDTVVALSFGDVIRRGQVELFRGHGRGRRRRSIDKHHPALFLGCVVRLRIISAASVLLSRLLKRALLVFFRVNTTISPIYHV